MDMWLGDKPEQCELCDRDVGSYFVDGKTREGHWALMCMQCHLKNGGLLGLGLGQMYDSKTLELITGK